MPDTTYGVVIRHAVIERFSQIVNEDLHGYVKISDSLIRDIGWRSVQLRYPTQDSFIERNTFVRAAGVFIQEAKIPDGARLYVRWNRFVDFWAESLPEPGWVNTYGGEGEPTIVSGNTFQTVGHVAVDLVAADPSAGWIPGLDATGNDWGTTDTNVIESMIRDVNDDPNLVSSIPDMPYLDAADPLTPPPYQEAHARSVSIRLRVATRQQRVTSESGIPSPHPSRTSRSRSRGRSMAHGGA